MISHEIVGDDMQAVMLTMNAGEEVRAEAGAMMYMTDGIEMDARMQGGLLGGLKRKLLAGESLFLTFFRCADADRRGSRSRGPYPGKIIRMPIAEQRGSLPARLISLRRRRASTSTSRSPSGSAPASSAARASSCRSSRATARCSSTAAARSSRWS